MKFISEKKRREHPTARLISSHLWVYVFNFELTTLQEKLMSLSIKDITELPSPLIYGDNQAKALWISLLLSHEISIDEMLALQQGCLPISNNDLLFVATATGHASLFKALIKKDDRLKLSIKNDDYALFFHAMATGKKDIIDCLIECVPNDLTKMLSSRNNAVLYLAAREGHAHLVIPLHALLEEETRLTLSPKLLASCLSNPQSIKITTYLCQQLPIDKLLDAIERRRHFLFIDAIVACNWPGIIQILNAIDEAIDNEENPDRREAWTTRRAAIWLDDNSVLLQTAFDKPDSSLIEHFKTQLSTKQIQRKLSANNYYLFHHAVKTGDAALVMWAIGIMGHEALTMLKSKQSVQSVQRITPSELAKQCGHRSLSRQLSMHSQELEKRREEQTGSISQTLHLVSSPTPNQEEVDEFGNQVKNAQFESHLSRALLNHAPTESLSLINQALIDYLTTNKDRLLEQKAPVLHASLQRYKIPYNQDSNPVDALIELLSRPLDKKDRAQVISETFTLHLLLFNYQHIYEPDSSSLRATQPSREAIHRRLRPNESGQMFAPEVRGRDAVYSKKRDKNLGICDEAHTPLDCQNFHRHEFTPFKYRARANEDSPIVQAFRRHGVAYIAGPSGTAADCLEGLHFLLPTLNFKQLQQYLNLLAAAETAQGHHAIHEVILTATNAHALPAFEQTLKDKPIWEQINYQHSYVDFLSEEFKTTKEFKTLKENYPDFLNAERAAENPLEALNRHITSVQRTFRSLRAARVFHQGPFWQKAEKTRHQPVTTGPHDNVIKQRSQVNLQALKAQVLTLSPEEKRFLRLFMAQEFQLTHYTRAEKEIAASGQLLSNAHLTTQLGPGNFTNNSEDDVSNLQNGDYVFYRMELIHKRHRSSRFGQSHIILNGRQSGLLTEGHVSLFELLNPESASILTTLKHHDKTVRTYSDGKIYYSQGRNRPLDLADTHFHGADIMQGVALCMIRELRLIGGDMQGNFLAQFQGAVDIESDAYHALIESMNDTLSQLFRLEAKLATVTELHNQAVEIFNPVAIQQAILNEDVLELRRLFAVTDINRCIKFPCNLAIMNALDFAVLNNTPLACQWLKQHEAQMSPVFLKRLNTQYRKPISGVKSSTLINVMKHQDSLEDLGWLEQDKSGKTLLHIAAKRLDYPLLEACFDQLIALDTVDSEGKTCMDYLTPIVKFITTKSLKDIEWLILKCPKLLAHFIHSTEACSLYELALHAPSEELKAYVEGLECFKPITAFIDEPPKDDKNPPLDLTKNIIELDDSIKTQDKIKPYSFFAYEADLLQVHSSKQISFIKN